jgi:hypothetical protein
LFETPSGLHRVYSDATRRGHKPISGHKVPNLGTRNYVKRPAPDCVSFTYGPLSCFQGQAINPEHETDAVCGMAAMAKSSRCPWRRSRLIGINLYSVFGALRERQRLLSASSFDMRPLMP